LECLANGSEQFPLLEGLREKLDGPCFHGSDRSRDVAVAGNEDQWNLPAGICQYTLEVEPVHSGHPEIGYQACRDIRRASLQKLVR
jgi:hypothetical protein